MVDRDRHPGRSRRPPKLSPAWEDLWELKLTLQDVHGSILGFLTWFRHHLLLIFDGNPNFIEFEKAGHLGISINIICNLRKIVQSFWVYPKVSPWPSDLWIEFLLLLCTAAGHQSSSFSVPLNASLGRTKMSTGTATHPHVHSNLKATLNHNESHFKPHVFPQIFQV